MATTKYWTQASFATATAIALSFPIVGQPLMLTLEPAVEYRPLDEASSRLVSNAVAPIQYLLGDSLALFSVIAEVALRLVKNSKPLDSGFSEIVNKEFWNLLK